ncbi:glycosyltransferase family A protein [Nesterenkonia populi]|uniref:glycosyltransferase family A protein n=1 Tax=Nesterenkonia populi TaxID=1591087 RepID=UPI0011BE02CB|nr:glycosyltransferase family 2 protein [Nesterenkonia populi]
MSGGAAERRPTVSVVIPCKDDSAFLGVCLAALSRQTRRADEVIVVDNDSSDASAAVAEAAGAAVVWCAAPGIPAASSRGYDAAAGELILRMDADCIPGPLWIEEVIAAFEARPDVSALTGPARFYDGPTVLRTPLAAAYLGAYALVSAAALGHRPLFGSHLAMRAEAWEAVRDSVHREDPEIHDDMDLSFHLGGRHRVGYLRGGTKMGISMRPFYDVGALRRRFVRGIRTVTVHWPEDFPPYRWRRVLHR